MIVPMSDMGQLHIERYEPPSRSIMHVPPVVQTRGNVLNHSKSLLEDFPELKFDGKGPLIPRNLSQAGSGYLSHDLEGSWESHWTTKL